MTKPKFSKEEREDIDKAFDFLANVKPPPKGDRNEICRQEEGDRDRRFRIVWGDDRPEVREYKDGE